MSHSPHLFLKGTPVEVGLKETKRKAIVGSGMSSQSPFLGGVNRFMSCMRPSTTPDLRARPANIPDVSDLELVFSTWRITGPKIQRYAMFLFEPLRETNEKPPVWESQDLQTMVNAHKTSLFNHPSRWSVVLLVLFKAENRMVGFMLLVICNKQILALLLVMHLRRGGVVTTTGNEI